MWKASKLLFFTGNIMTELVAADANEKDKYGY